MAGAFLVNAHHPGFLQNMKWLTRGVLVLLALAGVVALVPFFVSLNDYVPQVEAELSTRLKTPVSIDALHASLVPIPHVRVEGIAIGKAEEITVAKVTLTPDLWSLFGSNKVIRSVRFEDVVLAQSAFGPLLALAKGDSGSGTLTIEKIELKTAVIKLEQGSFGPFDAEVQVGTGGQQGDVTLKTQDGALQARVVPSGKQYTFDISAKSWTPPLGPKIRFDTLQVKGLATGEHAELNEMSAKLYGGTLAGRTTIDWAKGIQVAGQLEAVRPGAERAGGGRVRGAVADHQHLGDGRQGAQGGDGRPDPLGLVPGRHQREHHRRRGFPRSGLGHEAGTFSGSSPELPFLTPYWPVGRLRSSRSSAPTSASCP